MSNAIIKIHNVETEEIVELVMNKDEQAIYLTNITAAQNYPIEREAKAAARASALAKLAALGLSADEIAAL